MNTEALTYWTACKQYRQAFSIAGRTNIAVTVIKPLHASVTNPRIKSQLLKIMSQEKINVEDQSQDSGS